MFASGSPSHCLPIGFNNIHNYPEYKKQEPSPIAHYGALAHIRHRSYLAQGLHLDESHFNKNLTIITSTYHQFEFEKMSRTMKKNVIL